MNLLQRARSYRKQKSLGQNFLVSEKILDGIVRVSDLDPAKDIVIEIGPGIGFLTERLVENCYRLYSVELDAGTSKFLKLIRATNDHFNFLRADFLALSIEDILQLNVFGKYEHLMSSQENDEPQDTYSYSEKDKELGEKLLAEVREGKRAKFKIVANIPYQITTKILEHIIGDFDAESNNKKYVSEINILVQKEFAQRLTSEPGTKAYGAITLMVQNWAEVEYCIDVPSGCFDPAPKVDSAFIKLRVREEPLLKDVDLSKVKKFIKAIFANRRKKLANGLKAAGYSQEIIDKLELPENLRGETLNIFEIADLVRKI